jgi:hypothetical protein
LQSRVTFQATAGTTYRVQVGGFNNAFGSLVVSFASAPPPPANDLFANAVPVPTLPMTLTADTTSATTEPGEPVSFLCGAANVLIGNTVWYTFTPTVPVAVTIDTFGSNFDTIVAVYTGNAVNALSQVACNDDAAGTRQSQVAFPAGAGITYRIQVGGFGNAFGNLVVNFTPTAPPPNDNFANAIAIPSLPAQQTAVTLAATTEPGEPISCSGVTYGRTVWYTFTPQTTSGTVTVDTFGSNFDTVLAVYTGNAVSALAQITCNDNAPGSTQSQVSFTANVGTTYRIQAGGANLVGGNLVITFTGTAADRAPSAKRQLADRAAGVDRGQRVNPAKPPVPPRAPGRGR